MSDAGKFEPDWSSPPGETIVDLLEELDLSRNELAVSMGWTVAKVDALLTGELPLTVATAEKLESLLGAPATFWVTRELQFREDQARLQLRGESDV